MLRRTPANLIKYLFGWRHAPYIGGFLAFRKARPLQALIEKQKAQFPEFTPQVIMVDGNGILHKAKFGHASHLGVLVDIPTIGVAKKLYQIPSFGIQEDSPYLQRVRNLRRVGDSLPLTNRNDGQVLAAVVKTSARAKPVFVSVGHNIDLRLAKRVVLRCSRSRIPEPINKADLTSRDFVKNFQGGGDLFVMQDGVGKYISAYHQSLAE